MLRRIALVLAVAAGTLALATSLATARPTPGGGSAGKLDSHLQTLVAAQRAHAPVRALGAAQDLRVIAGRVLVDVYVNGDVGSAATRLRATGMDVRASTSRAPVPVVEGWLAIDSMTRVAALPTTKAILPVTATGVDAGSVMSEGDAPQRDPQARALGTSGAGIPVGVMSDSINQVGGGVAASQATGDLPPGVSVLVDGGGGTDEGRAMSEIIFDEAPGISQLFFETGAGGPVEKANAITDLVAHGVRVIADDTFYLTEPFFQEGTVAQAVDTAKASGVAYFASAGNRARQSWEGTYAAGAGNFNDFGGGATRQTVTTVPDGGTIRIVAQWDEPWGGAVTDLDLFLYNHSGGTQLASAQTDNLASGFPVESLAWHNTTGSAVAVDLGVLRAASSGTPRNPFIKYIASGDFGPFTISQFATNSDAINPDAAAAPGSMAVGAVFWNQAGHNQPEPFSSRGPKTLLFDTSGTRLTSPLVEQKPQLAASDGVTTSVPGFDSGAGGFFGTSAATPSAAGVATLALAANPALSVAQLTSIMTNPANAVDCLAPGDPDTDCGSGFIQADAIVRQAQSLIPPPVAAPAPTVSVLPIPFVPSNVFSVGRFVKHRNGSADLRVTLPGPGTLNVVDASAVKGAGVIDARRKRRRGKPALIRPVTLNVAGAGAVVVHLKPTSSASRLLAQGKAVRIRLRITFTPTGGSKRSTIATVVLRRAGRHRR